MSRLVKEADNLLKEIDVLEETEIGIFFENYTCDKETDVGSANGTS